MKYLQKLQYIPVLQTHPTIQRIGLLSYLEYEDSLNNSNFSFNPFDLQSISWSLLPQSHQTITWQKRRSSSSLSPVRPSSSTQLSSSTDNSFAVEVIRLRPSILPLNSLSYPSVYTHNPCNSIQTSWAQKWASGRRMSFFWFFSIGWYRLSRWRQRCRHCRSRLFWKPLGYKRFGYPTW